ncbi:hypothetical protein D9757_000215 [Collybiopsis confluens]|uniref:DNA-directed RNA polymerase III subunit RPC6 n=1 Tax=Collybiopsis confluens TaxID=2823264 RepID=A0A8H5I5B3_9AGAR|nr:hypothetical protein D9757_000215 [Collybiopsis confluens]
MSVNPRPPTAHETSLHHAAISSPNNAKSILLLGTTHLNLNLGLLKPLKNSKGALSFRAVTKSEHSTNIGLTEEEKVVLGHIRAAQNEGIWVKHLKAKTNFHQAVLDRSMKTLEQKKLIKRTQSVQHPTRKIYMLEGLTPSVSLTGGPWFTDGEFDTEFIETLMKACFKFIRDTSFPRARGQQPDGALYPISKSPQYPNAQQVRNALKQARLTETDLTVEHVEMLLNVLVLDGEIERLPSFGSTLWDSGAIDEHDSEDEKRSKKKRKHDSSDSEDDKATSRSKKKKNKKSRASDSEDTASTKKKTKRKREMDTDDSDDDDTSRKRKSKKKKKKRREESSDESSSDDESARKRKSKHKSRRASSNSDSDSDSDDGRSRRSKSKSSKRSPSPFLSSFDEVGGSVYRAIQEERLSLGWSQAPCSTCPTFEFCRGGGPVNPAECVYYGEWLNSGSVPAIEDAL